MNTATTAHHFAWDLTKATLTSLAILSATGCGSEPPIEPPRPSTPQNATPVEVVSKGAAWEGRQITVHAKPAFVEDRSTVDIPANRSGALLNVDLRYAITVTPEAGTSFELPVIYSTKIKLEGNSVALDGSYTKQFKLPANANVITGKIHRFENGVGVYLGVEQVAFEVPRAEASK